MLYTIISESDIFYSAQTPEFKEKRIREGITTMIKVDGKYQPFSFFSTDPKAYLNPKNNINSLYYS